MGWLKEKSRKTEKLYGEMFNTTFLFIYHKFVSQFACYDFL